MGHVLIAQFGDVNQPFDVVVRQTSKGPEFDQFGDCALYQLAHCIFADRLGPRIRLQALQAEADALAFTVHIEYVDLNLIAHFQHLAGVSHPSPGQF